MVKSRYRSAVCVICVGALIAAMAGPAGAQSAAPAAAGTATLTVLGADLDATRAGLGHFDFGQIDIFKPVPLVHVFHLRNGNPAPIVIGGVESSCGCTSALLGTGGTTATIDPGGTVSVKVTVDPARLYPGHIDKLVWVYTDTKPARRPLATLRVTGSVQPLVSFTPKSLFIGRVKAGGAASVPLKVVLDPRLIVADPKLVSTNTNLEIITEAPPAGTEPAPNVRYYSVHVSPRSSIGPAMGVLRFISTMPETPALKPALAALINGQVWVSAYVAGSISAMPQSVVFGVVNRGAAATRTVTLYADTPTALKHLTVSSASAYITARMGSVTATPKSRATPSAGALGGVNPQIPAQLLNLPALNAYTSSGKYQMPLDVTAGGKVPPGTLQTVVTVTTAKGERLVLPVMLYVPPATTR